MKDDASAPGRSSPEKPVSQPKEAGQVRALVIGEALVDIVRRADEPTQEFPGGSPANVALGVARLGREVELITWLGDDEHGNTVSRHLEASGVRIAPGSKGAPRTSTAVATLNVQGAASYEFDLHWDPPMPRTSSDPLVVHAGSISAVLEPGASTVRKMVAVHRHSATITFDPNIRPQVITDHQICVAAVEEMITAADVVKVSDEDFAWLYPDRDPRQTAREWVKAGAGLVCLTMGAEGAWATTSAAETSLPAAQAPVVDTIGAGDSFMAALIDALWSADLLGSHRRQELRHTGTDQLARLLQHSTMATGITVSRSGANPPTRREMGI